MDPDEARGRFAAARVARLATVSADGQPHVVPIVFALDGDVLYTAVDRKPKSGGALKRLANIAANPRVSVLADSYAEDWQQLWWVRGDGTARVLDHHDTGLALLAGRYPVYVDEPPPGPVIVVGIGRWSGWRASGA